MTLRAPSPGANASNFFPVAITWTLHTLRTAEFGCLASTPSLSKTIPLAFRDYYEHIQQVHQPHRC